MNWGGGGFTRHSVLIAKATAYCCPGLSPNKNIVGKKAKQERDVSLWGRE